MTKAIKALIIERAKWLKKKKLTLRKFADATGNDFGTVYFWFENGRTPRRKYLDPVLAVYPDWPQA